MLWETLDEEAAEAVRSHLVALRGGAPFLSPDDASLLRSWLDDGWTSTQIVLALERAADARRRRPRRLPLTLRSARTHLGKASKGQLRRTSALPSPTPEAPLAALTAALRRQAQDDARGPTLVALADQLDALPADDPNLVEARATTLCRDFLLSAWGSLAPWEREARIADARASLSKLEGVLPEASLAASAEEIARDQLRQSYSLLSAATIRQAAGLATESPE